MLYRSILTLLLSIQVTASCAPLWNPYVEVRGRSGDYRSGAMLYGFAPLVQDDCSILFAQGNIGQMRHQTTGSLGFGYRRKIECDSFFGIAGFADWARTGQHNNYLQGVVSGELVVRWAELRANGYVPYQKSHVLDSVFEIDVFLEELDIKQVTRSFQTAEQAYPGFDLEGGFNHELGCKGRIRGYAAYFHYARQGVSDIYGPRFRVRYELDNMGCCGARFIAEGLWQRDNVRGTKGEAMIGFRVPLCRPKCCNLCPVERRMNDLVERDIGLITRKNTRQTSETEELLTHLFFFERDAMGRGTQDDPASLDFVQMTALPGDILFGLNSDSNLPIDLTEAVQLKKGQGLYGFDNQSSVEVFAKGALFPIIIDDQTGNGRAELRQTVMEPVVVAANDTIIFGLKLTDGTIGIDMTNVDNVFVDKVYIDPPSVAGINLVNATSILVQNSVVEAVTAVAVNVDGGGNIAFDNCMFSNNGGGTGFNIQNMTDGPLTVDSSVLTQTGSMAAIVQNSSAVIDLSGLAINGTNGISTTQILVTNNTGGTINFGQVSLTNLDNTVGNDPFVHVEDNMAPVSFASLTVAGEGGKGLFAMQTKDVTTLGGSLNIVGDFAAQLLQVDNLDIQLASVTNSDSTGGGLGFAASSGTFVVTGPTSVQNPASSGIELEQCTNIHLTFASLDIDGPSRGVVSDDSTGSFTAGTTNISSLGDFGVEVKSSTMDWKFDALTINSSDDCINWINSSGMFEVLGDVNLTSMTNDGIDLEGVGTAQFMLGDLTISTGQFGVKWSDAAGSFSAGDTTITSTGPAGIAVLSNAMADWTFNTLDITSQGNSVNWQDSSGKFVVTGATTLMPSSSYGFGIFGMGTVDFSLGSLTITNPQSGIYWEDASGSFVVEGNASIQNSSIEGIYMSDSPQIVVDFKSELEIVNSGDDAVYLDGLTGTFDAQLVTITNPIGAFSNSVAVNGGDLDVTIERLEVDSSHLNSGDVSLSFCQGDFIVKGGHIILNAPDCNGITASSCSGAISFSGTDGDPFEVSGMGMGNATNTVAGVWVGACESISLKYCDIHDIGDGNNNRYGLFVTAQKTSVTVENSVFENIWGDTDESSGIRVNDNEHDSSTLTVSVTDNVFFGEPDFTEMKRGVWIDFGSLMADMGTLEANISSNEFHDLNIGVLVELGDYSTNNRVTINDNTIEDIGDFVDASGIFIDPFGNSVSTICIERNILDYDTDGNTGGNATAIMVSHTALNSNMMDLTIRDNTALTSNTGQWLRGIEVTTAGDTTTCLIDQNTASANPNAIFIQSQAGISTLNATLTNNTAPLGSARCQSTLGTLNVLFGNPSGAADMGNNIPLYDFIQPLGTLNLGAVDTGGTVTQALSDLGNVGGVSTSGTINLIPTTSVPQPMPCPPVVE